MDDLHATSPATGQAEPSAGEQTSVKPLAPEQPAPKPPATEPPAVKPAAEPATAEPPAVESPAAEPTASEQTTAEPATPESARPVPEEDAPTGPPGFGERGRMRRRARFLRKARELAYRDLGGLVFDLHRFGKRNDTLVLAKLDTIGRIDGELRALEDALSERRPVTVLREAGVAACPRCAAIHGSDDRFCPNCGLAMDLRAERPVAGPPPAAPAQVSAPTPGAPTPGLAPTSAVSAMPQTAVHAPGPALSAPAARTTPPADPAPTANDGPAKADEQPSVEQPTEIVRPPAQSP
jgi:hypothetical protein